MPTKRRRHASGDLTALRRMVWATLCYLDGVVQNEELDHDTRLRSAHGVVVSAGVFRNVLADRREEATREALATLAAQDARQQLAIRNGLDDEDALVGEIDEGLPAEWNAYVEQSAARGTAEVLDQSVVLFGRPRPNKELVQAAVLSGPVTSHVVVMTSPTPPPPSVMPARVMPSPIDADDARLAALESEVGSLLHDLRRKVSSSPEDATYPR